MHHRLGHDTINDEKLSANCEGAIRLVHISTERLTLVICWGRREAVDRNNLQTEGDLYLGVICLRKLHTTGAIRRPRKGVGLKRLLTDDRWHCVGSVSFR